MLPPESKSWSILSPKVWECLFPKPPPVAGLLFFTIYIRKQDFWLWPNAEVANPLLQIATINLDKVNRNSHFITLAIFRGIQNWRSFYSWKTAELQVRTVGICGVLASGCSHLLPTPSLRGRGVFSAWEAVTTFPKLLREKGLTQPAVGLQMSVPRGYFSRSLLPSLLCIFQKK